MKIRILLLMLMLTGYFIRAQDRFELLEEKLIQLAKNYPGINEQVELSMNGATIQEYIKTIGATNNINVNVDPGLDISFQIISVRLLRKRYSCSYVSAMIWIFFLWDQLLRLQI